MRKRRKARNLKKRGTKHFFHDVWHSWKKNFFAKRTESPIFQESPFPPSSPKETVSSNLHDAISIGEKWKTLQNRSEESLDENRRATRFFLLRKKVIKLIFIFTAVALIISSVGYIINRLYKKSEYLEGDLKAAIRQADWLAVHKKLALTDVSLYHLLNHSLAYSIGDAETWIQRQKESYKQLKAKIESIESGETPLNTLSIHAIAEMERALRALPPDINDLSGRLSLQYANNRSMFSKNRNYVMEQLLSCPDIHTYLTKNPHEDCKILQEKINEWEDFLETCNAYDIPPHLAERGRRHLLELKRFYEEAHTLQDFNQRIHNIVIYSELKNWAQGKQAEKYPPTCALLSFLKKLPPLEEWQSSMLPINQLIEPDKRSAARKSLMENGATFSLHFPATQAQYAIAKELFQTPSLWKPIYQIIHSDGRMYLSDEYPQKRYSGKQYAHFHLSELDEAYSADKDNIIRWDAAEVSVRRINCAEFMQSSGISRDTFFTHMNLPQLLEKIAEHNDKECPTLAKAFVYDCVLSLLQSHPIFHNRVEIFSQKLAEDAISFKSLRNKYESFMKVGTWLAPMNKTATAEKEFAAWFKAHKNRNYNKQIADNVAPLFRATPYYVGFVDNEGIPHLRQAQTKGKVIWYLSEKGICSTDAGKLPENALPYSPLFIDSTQK
ncbi:MAG: hypothetical protein IJB31_06495 [Akkermansia sp.]|nr:hypothetical protein [Akkermansia sp.]